MKIITPEEKANMELAPMNSKKGRRHPVRAALEELETGQILYIKREDFKWKRRTPLFICNVISRKSGKKFKLWKETAKVPTGPGSAIIVINWVVQRIE